MAVLYGAAGTGGFLIVACDVHGGKAMNKMKGPANQLHEPTDDQKLLMEMRSLKVDLKILFEKALAETGAFSILGNWKGKMPASKI